MTTTHAAASPLTVTTREWAAPTAPAAWLPDGEPPVAWLRRGDGLVGWGEAARLDVTGPDRFAAAEQWWRDVTARMEVHDPVNRPGSGPVCFASLSFADEPGRSVLVVPRVVLGRSGDRGWITHINPDGDTAAALPAAPGEPRSPVGLQFGEATVTAEGYRTAVAAAVRRMQSGIGPPLHKIVLAHDLLATAQEDIDPRFLLRGLSRRYPECWSFAVDGLVGATPEMLLARTGDQVRTRVLAGTTWPREGVDADQLAEELLSSAKNLDEHAYAVESLTETLRPFCSRLSVPQRPDVLRLPNVQHLSTSISGDLRHDRSDGAPPSLLRLAAAVHPTAAVGGTPTPTAVQAITELEGMDRGRYAGPVGWLDSAGNGELGLALRCAEVDGNRARLFAGGGIVGDSDPDTEVAEARAKFRPMREALLHS